jgi:tetratricopeptide (TPR) repeat protein
MTQPSRAAVQDALRQAQMSFNQGNYSAAEPIYKQMVESIPPESEEYALCLHNLGEINEQRGNLTTAIWWQQRLISHNLMTHAGMVNHLFYRMGHIAALYTRAGRPPEANALYQQMNALRPMLTDQLPPGFQPQSEVGNFLKGLFDAQHKKYVSDPVEGEQTRAALTQLAGGPAAQNAQSAGASGAAAYTGQTAAQTPAPNSSPVRTSQSGSYQSQSTSQGQAASNQGPPAGQYQAPATQYQAPANQYQAPPNQYQAPANQYQAPQNQYQAPPSQNVRPSTSSDDDNEVDDPNWTQKLGWNDDEDSLPTVGTKASRPSSANVSRPQAVETNPPPGSRDYGTNDLEQIPTPVKDVKKPATPRGKQQDVSPAFLKKEDNSYNPNYQQELKPAGKPHSSKEPEWEPPRRGKAPKALKPKKFKRDSITTEDDFAPKRRIGQTEADTLDAAPTEMNSNLEGMMTAWTQLSNSKNAPIIFFGVIAFVVIGIFMLPYKGKPYMQFNGMPHYFCTIDGTKALTLSPIDCKIESGKDVQHDAYKFYFGDWRETFFLAFGQLPEKQYWLTDKRTALIDDNGIPFYDTNGSERRLYKAMESISRAVSSYYNTHGNKYPTSGEDLGAADLTYENPYTKQNSVASIQATALGDPTTKAGEKARANIYTLLTTGQNWENEKKLKPGAINCLSALIETSRGPIQAFFMQAGDETGKPIMGSNPGESCYLALEDGKGVYAKSDPLPFAVEGTMRKKIVVVLEEPINSGLAYIIRNAACWLFSFMAFVGAAVYFALPKRSHGKAIAIACIVIFGALTTLYMINNRL